MKRIVAQNEQNQPSSPAHSALNPLFHGPNKYSFVCHNTTQHNPKQANFPRRVPDLPPSQTPTTFPTELTTHPNINTSSHKQAIEKCSFGKLCCCKPLWNPNRQLELIIVLLDVVVVVAVSDGMRTLSRSGICKDVMFCW